MRKSGPKAKDTREPRTGESGDMPDENVPGDAAADAEPRRRDEHAAASAASGGDDEQSPARGAEEARADDAEGNVAVAVEDAAALREELDELNDKHLRLAAEFNNFRRRTEQERLLSWSRAQAEIVGRMLTVLDDLQRVAKLDTASATVESIMEGIDLVERKFVRTLEDVGVDVHDPLGEAFDPEVMEAMMRVPAESEEQDGTVAQVFEKGYSLAGTLIRPARVSVYVLG